MALLIQKIGLLCPQNNTFYACPDANIPFVGCCTSDPCKDMSGNCPISDLLAATFDLDGPAPNFSHDCLGGEWYTCPELKIPFVGCCSRDACQARCPAPDLRAAVLADDNNPVFRMAVVASEDSNSASSTATGKDTSSSEIKDTLSFVSTTPTVKDVPTGTTSTPSPAETSALADPNTKTNASKSRKVGLGIGATIIGLIVFGCISHKVARCIRKYRRRNARRANRDSNRRPLDVPIELNPVNAPGTRSCGISRVPGQATRPRSWEDEHNNRAEAKLTGLPGPRRVRSAEAAGIVNRQAKAFERVSESMQSSQHALSLPATHDSSAETSHVVEGSDSQPSKKRRPRGWVTGSEHAKHHGHYSEEGDFSVDIDGDGRGSHSTGAHNRPADKLYRQLAPYSQASRSDDQLSHVIYPEAGEQRPAPRSDGAAQVLNEGNYPVKNYKAYTPTKSVHQQASEPQKASPSHEVYELEADSVGEIRDFRARPSLGNLYAINADPIEDESTVLPLENAKDEPKEKYTEIKDNASVSDHSPFRAEVKVMDFSLPKWKKDSDMKPPVSEKKQTMRGADFCPESTSQIVDKKASQIRASEAASTLSSMSKAGSILEDPQKQPTGKRSDMDLGQTEFMTTASASERSYADATGGLPALSPDSSRQCSSAGMSVAHKNAHTTDGRSAVSPDGTRPGPLSAGIFPAAESSQRTAVSSVISNSQPHNVACSSTAQTSLAAGAQSPTLPAYHPSYVPRWQATAREQDSGSHMSGATNNGPRRPSQRPTNRRPWRSVVSPHGRQRQDRGRYVGTPRNHGSRGVPRSVRHGGRYHSHPSQHVSSQHNPDQAQPSMHHRAPHQSQQLQHHAGQFNAWTHHLHAQAYQTHVYHPYRAYPPQPVVTAPPAAAQTHRAAQELSHGRQPQPAYRGFQEAISLNHAAHGNIGQPQPAYYPGAGVGSYGSPAASEYAPPLAGSDYAESWDENRDYVWGSSGSPPMGGSLF